jgi:multimeric flavodoxin WrbA
MKVLLIKDKDLKTIASVHLEKKLSELFQTKGYDVKDFEIGKENMTSCIGCFSCWIKNPGVCIINDMVNTINRECVNSDFIIFLTPVIFGQFSANIKNALDRSIPAQLPFFKKVNGVTAHPWRYGRFPAHIFVGYSDDMLDEEKDTFTYIVDITSKHSRDIRGIFVCRGQRDNEDIAEAIRKIV